jgi:hypothetical protein
MCSTLKAHRRNLGDGEAVHTNSRTTKISADSDYVRRHIEQGGTFRRASRQHRSHNKDKNMFALG